MIERKKKLIYALLAILFSYVIIVAVIYVVIITSSPEHPYLEEIKWRGAHNLVLFISILYLLILPPSFSSDPSFPSE